MKFFQIILLLSLLTGCDSDQDLISAKTATEAEGSKPLTGIFNIRNSEIRGEILVKLVEFDIQHQIREDGSISYQLSDGELIDEIGNEIIMAYIRRN